MNMMSKARNEGLPTQDGYYCYYELGEPVPQIVRVGDYKGYRAVSGPGGRIQRHWYEGEFFVGPIEPPFPQPVELAKSRHSHSIDELQAMERRPQQAAGRAVSGE